MALEEDHWHGTDERSQQRSRSEENAEIGEAVVKAVTQCGKHERK